MKPDAYLINTARGAVVDEQALYECLKAQRIAGACLDVYTAEPIDETVPPFAELENVILTPHANSITNECVRDMGRQALGAILAVADGKKPGNLVNPEVWERPSFQQKLAGASRAGALGLTIDLEWSPPFQINPDIPVCTHQGRAEPSRIGPTQPHSGYWVDRLKAEMGLLDASVGRSQSRDR